MASQLDGVWDLGSSNSSRMPSVRTTVLEGGKLGSQLSNSRQRGSTDKLNEYTTSTRPGAMPRPVGGTSKLGTFTGVFVPTSLNIISILLFLRFGMILGQSGLLAMLIMLIAAYIINLVTTLSISAIATNGTVRGGGAYYLISRSLGPEFGGSIGMVLYLGFVFNTGMNAVGLVDCLKQNFGSDHGNWASFLPEGKWFEYLWATIILTLCTLICMAGSAIFARASNGLLAILLIATFSIPFSTVVMQPFREPALGIEYTGYSLATLRDNLFPRFTRHAAGSQLLRENYQDLFGILFPATGGIFAGASMSGDLKHPSKAIPKGTLSSLVLTFGAYTLVLLTMAATITRESLYNDANIVQDVNLSGAVVLLGEFSSTFFSSLMGVIGSAKLLQAIARDNIIPGISIFSQGTARGDEPLYAILVTHIVAQATMLFDINQIASFVTMTYLMTFLGTNLACFLLKISSAPNFRPSFHYFNWQTAAFGTLVSGVSMFFVDGSYATGCVGLLIAIFLLIHYFSAPKSWGDVSQSLIYHQVRKYLLRLRQEHVKFWRPQVLLLVNDPRRQYKLIQFCNSLKKGSLFVLGHVIVSNEFSEIVPEARKQQAAWMKYIDVSRVKAFVDISIAPSLEWGSRNLLMNAGLGGMRPNIVVMGMYNLNLFRAQKPLVDISNSGEPPKTATPPRRASEFGRKDSETERASMSLPTDANRQERDITPSTWVRILEDLLLGLRINVAIAKGFDDLHLPRPRENNKKKYIDLWPIQMSAEITAEEGSEKQNILTTNFDTYTLILQLGCILNTVSKWKRAYTLRVAVFVEYESDVEDQRQQLQALLTNLRINAEVLVFWLASGELQSYMAIVDGNYDGSPGLEEEIDKKLAEDEWWQEIQRLRGRGGEPSASEELANEQDDNGLEVLRPSQIQRQNSRPENLNAIRQFMQSFSRRRSTGNLAASGPRFSMMTQRLDDEIVNRHAVYASASESSESDTDTATESDSDKNTTMLPLSRVRTSHAKGENRLRNRPRPGIIQLPSDEEVARGRSSPRRSQVQNYYGTDDRVLPMPSEQAKSPLTPVVPKTPGSAPLSAPLSAALRTPLSMHSTLSADSRPRPSRRSSAAKFTSHPVPETTLAADDGPGPSIMFAESSRPKLSQNKSSIYDRTSQPASGFPSAQSIPLSFNDLRCRAQHLILNELIRKHSADTAVLFTTLPSPDPGICESEEDSMAYLVDLEVLLEGLPPTMLVHSNNVTVTVNL